MTSKTRIGLKTWILSVVITVLTVACPVSAEQHAPKSGQYVRAENVLVVSASEYASRTDRDVLKRGGNAVDAVVATAAGY